MRSATSSQHALWLAGALACALAGCPDDGKRPLNAACTDGVQCESGLCLSDVCLDPDADEDQDGLTNGAEGALGTDPFNGDTDGDGIGDLAEVVNAGAAEDSDGDGKNDAVESNVADADSDCLRDQFDADDAVKEVAPEVLGAKLCPTVGVCGADGAVVKATCALVDGAPTFTCDFADVPNYQAPETRCDDADNDCNGVVDDAHGAGGSVTLTDLDGTTGLVKDDACGVGACAGGTVQCADATALGCSTHDAVGSEVCDTIDNDCNGGTDEPFAAGGTIVFDGGPFGADAGKVLGAPCGTGNCDGGIVMCDGDDDRALTCSTLGNASAESCASGDDDCDGAVDEGGPDLPQCTVYYEAFDSDDYGSDFGMCLCAPTARFSKILTGDCNDDDPAIFPGATAICGQDADCVDGLPDAGEVCDDGNAVLVDGCQMCAAVPFATISDTETANHYSPAVVGVSDGFAVLWTRNDGGNGGIAGAVFNETAELAVEAPVTGEFPGSVVAAPMSDGGFVAGWTQYEGLNAMYAQRYDDKGAHIGTPFNINGQEGAVDLALAGLDSGRVLAAYTSTGGDRDFVQVRFFKANGLPEGAAFRAGSDTAWNQNAHIVSWPSGASVVAYEVIDDQTFDRHIELQGFTTAGAKDGPVSLVPLTAPEETGRFDLVGFPDGTHVVVFVLRPNDQVTLRSLQAQRFGADGAPLGGRMVIESDPTQFVSWDLSAAALAPDQVFVTWGDTGEVSVPGQARLFSAGGGAQLLIPLADPALYSNVSGFRAASGPGWFAAVFRGRVESTGHIFVQRVAPDGTKLYR